MATQLNSSQLYGFKPNSKEGKLLESVFDPAVFAKQWLNTDLWEKQIQILQALMTKPRVAVKACHSSGKTALAAFAVLWFLTRHKEVVIVTTAPTWGQVEKLLWGEIHSALLRSKLVFKNEHGGPAVFNTEIHLGPKRLAYGLSTSVTKSDEGVKFQGIHAENVLMILDEAPGVHPKIWEAIEGARAGGNVRVLAIGNPTIASGPFHNAFTDNRSGWTCFTINAFDTPNFDGVDLPKLLDPAFEDQLDNNVRGYLTTRRWVKEKYYEWGEGHPLWESRVLGEFPKQSEDALLSLAWLEDAQSSELKGKSTDPVTAGVDVAGPGEAETSLTIRRGPEILVHKQWPIQDPRGEIVVELNKFKHELSAVNVDAVAIGWYIYKHLEDLKFPAVPIIAQAPSSDSEKYADAKAEFYWGLRMRFASGEISGLVDEKTIGQLAGIRYKPNSRGQIEIESKTKAVDRGVKSPDRAESIMLAFADRKLVYGVLAFNAEEKKKAEETRIAIKRVQSEEKLQCKCGAVCVVTCQGGYRCNSCGLQWDLPVKQKEVVSTSRTQALRTRDRNRFQYS